MPPYKLGAKVKKISRVTSAESAKIRNAQELLKEVDSLALLLDEVRKQSERIQAAADALGDEVFQDLRPSKTSALSADGQTNGGTPIGLKLVARSRSDRSFPV